MPAYLAQVGSLSVAGSGFVGGPAGSESRVKVAGSPAKSGATNVAIGGSLENQQQRHPLRYITEPERAQLLEVRNEYSNLFKNALSLNFGSTNENQRCVTGLVYNLNSRPTHHRSEYLFRSN